MRTFSIQKQEICHRNWGSYSAYDAGNIRSEVTKRKAQQTWECPDCDEDIFYGHLYVHFARKHQF